jgi:MFS family permease
MRKWVVFCTVYFAGIVMVFNQFKVPPVMQTMMSQLNLSPAMAGWTMSIFSVTGILLSIPAAFILSKLRAKWSGLVGLGCSIVGCVIGAMAASPEILLAGRVVEGMGMGLIGVIAPSVIAMYFPHKELGLPMGIWSSWMGVGTTIVFSIGLPIESAFTWRGIWWFGTILSLISFVLYALIVKNPKALPDGEGTIRAEEKIPYAAGFKTPGIWLLGIVFFAMVFGFSSLATWAPVYFNKALGVSQAAANSYVTADFLASIVGGVLAGYVMTKIPNHKLLLVIFTALTGIVFAFTFSMPLNMVLPLMILAGIFSDAMAVAIYTLAPSAMPSPLLAGLGIGLVSTFQAIGNLAGPPVVGGFVESGVWRTANYPMWIVMIVGVAASVAGLSLIKARSGGKPHGA